MLAANESTSTEARPSAWNRPFNWVVLATVVVLGLVALIAHQFGKETGFTVQCDPIKGGLECTIKPTGERALDARVCWEIHDVCENGTKSMVAKCIRNSLEQGRDFKGLIANNEFSNVDQCDKVTRRLIESAYLEAARPAIHQSPAK